MAAPAIEASDRRLRGTSVRAALPAICVLERSAESRVLLQASFDRLSIERDVTTAVQASALRAAAELSVDLSSPALCVDRARVEWTLLYGRGADAVCSRISAAGEERQQTEA